MTEPKSILIIGGGHNGLVCATYLAKAGYQVQVLEARDTAGGGLSGHQFEIGTDQYAPGLAPAFVAPDVL